MQQIIDKLSAYTPPAEETYVPLEITFRMSSPTLMAHPWIHFDGLVLHLLYRDVLGDDYYALPSKDPIDFSQYIHAPLKRYNNSIYHASCSMFDTDMKFTTTIYKRFCTEYLHFLKTRKRKIRRGSGHYRDYRMRMICIPANSITFYANGSIHELTRLLQHVFYLGKKMAYGFGRVKSLHITKQDQDYSVVKKGKAMRPIPVTLTKYVETTTMLAYKPPYWDKGNVGLCAFPRTKVTLKNG